MAVVIGKLLYIEEFFNPECRTIKFWFAAQLTGGRLDCTHPEAVPEHITEAAWHPLASLSQLTVFPEMLTTCYVGDRNAGFPSFHPPAAVGDDALVMCCLRLTITAIPVRGIAATSEARCRIRCLLQIRCPSLLSC